MTKLGDTILEGLHQIKQMREGEDVGAKVHKMTNDKQTEMTFEEWVLQRDPSNQKDIVSRFITKFMAGALGHEWPNAGVQSREQLISHVNSLSDWFATEDILAQYRFAAQCAWTEYEDALILNKC